MTEKQKTPFKLWLTFLKIGAFTFGGGYAMIPLIQKETVEKKAWISDDELLEMVAIAESTPGPIAINAATFVGFRVAGFFGALCATLGVVLPSFFIIFALSFLLRQFQSVRAVRYAFAGIRAGVLALIFRALFIMYRQCPKKILSYIIAGLALIATAVFQINIILILLGCAAIGLISTLIMRRKEKTHDLS